MANKNTTRDWYSSDRLLSYGCSTNAVIGQRRNGKTYEIKNKFLEYYENDNDWFFIYIRQLHTQVAYTKVRSLFDDMKERCIEVFGGQIQYSPIKGFFVQTEECEKIIGRVASVEKCMDSKGVVFPPKCFIYFDEFINDTYFKDETRRYMNVIKSITSVSKQSIIFLSANTISRYCPYFDLWGIDIKKLKKGCIGVAKHKKGATVAVEYSKTRIELDDLGNVKDKYIGFDENETVNMMLYGDWQSDHENVKTVDGIGWSCKNRKLMPFYVTSLRNVYEITMYKQKYPIMFIRKINTQNGIVRDEIKYNLSHDNTVELLKNDGTYVPKFNKISKVFFSDIIYEKIMILKECLSVGRCIFDTVESGTEFKVAFNGVS